MMKRREKSGLGRGLSALMADIETPQQTAKGSPNADAKATGPREPRLIPIENIKANPNQPRRSFAENALDELAASISEKGIIQPLIVRPDPELSGCFQIVAGERRWRAAQRAQLHELPAIVRDFDDTEVLEVAIIENIQRADLNALDEAEGYRQLMDRFGHTQEKLSKAMGKSRSHIANLLRLLNLPENVQIMLREGALTAGHARAILTSQNPEVLANRAVSEGLSVRAVEALAKKTQTSDTRSVKKTRPVKDADTVALEGDLSATLGLPVSIEHDAATGEGRVSIKYGDLQSLDDLIRLLGG